MDKDEDIYINNNNENLFKEKLNIKTIIENDDNNNNTINWIKNKDNQGCEQNQIINYIYANASTVNNNNKIENKCSRNNQIFNYGKKSDKELNHHPYVIKCYDQLQKPSDCCNIRLRSNKREKGDHRLKVIFLKVNDKLCIFELSVHYFIKNIDILDIKRLVLDFSYVPKSSIKYIVSLLELFNVGEVKIRDTIGIAKKGKFNEKNNDFEVFKLTNKEKTIDFSDPKYFLFFLQSLTHKAFNMKLIVHQTGKINIISSILIFIQGAGYYSINPPPPNELSRYHLIFNDCMCHIFNAENMQTCGITIEEIDFGQIKEKPNQKVLVSYSKITSLHFDIQDPGFENGLDIKPKQEGLIKRTHKAKISKYKGELNIIILNTESIIKSKLREISRSIENAINENQLLIEILITDVTLEILYEQFDIQQLGLYDWTNDIPYITQDNARKKMIMNYFKEEETATEGNLAFYFFTVKRGKQFMNHLRFSETPKKMIIDLELSKKEDMTIHEKYINKLIHKY